MGRYKEPCKSAYERGIPSLMSGERTSRRSKIRVIYKPAKEIVILDYFQFSKDALDQMFARLIHSGLPIMAYWAEGFSIYIFSISS